MGNVGTKNSVTRDRWVEEALKILPLGSRILDAGAGEQQYRKMCSHLRYVAQDFAKYDGKGSSIGLQTGAWDQTNLDIVCDIIAIPEPDASFDAILCTEVLEHVPDPLLVIKELTRLLRKGGYMLITAPFCSLTHFAPFHFYTGFNRYFYETTLSTYGLGIIEISENGNYFEYLAQELYRVGFIADRYASDGLGRLEAMGLRLILKALERFSQKDTGSAELLNFGYHVKAVKL